MNEPKRLLEDGSAFERSLLESALREDPSREAEERILAAVAAAPLVAASGLPVAATRAPFFARLLRSRGLVVTAAAIGLGAVIAASLGARDGRDAHKEASSAPATAALVAATPVVPEVVAPAGDRAPPPSEAKPVEIVVTPESLPTVSAPARGSAAGSTARSPVAAARAGHAQAGASIEREVELLDAVKAELGSHDAARASRALDAYDSEFPNGALRPEGTVLRIRTLLLQGDRAAASKLADELLAKHPGSVHETRIRALLAE